MLMGHRHFASGYYRSLNDNPSEKLSEAQRKFENDPTNVDHAFYYFRELNRIGKFQTVTRLYTKYELPYAYNSNHKNYEKLK
jgi:hypothetical protein